MRSCHTSLALVLVACHADGSAPPDEGAPGTVIQIDTNESEYNLLWLRDGDGPWTTLESASRAFVVHADRYTVVAMCGFHSEVAMASAAVSDGALVELSCYGSSPPRETFHVNGTVVQPGAVAIGSAQSSTTPNWQFDFDIEGHQALVVLGNNKSYLRFLEVGESMTLPSIDVDLVGTDLASASYTLTGVAPNAVVTSRINAYMTDPARTWTRYDGLPAVAGTTVQLLPADYFRADTFDFQEAELVATLDGGEQVADVIATPAGMAIDMLPPLAGVVLSDGQASWTQPLPPGRVDLQSLVKTATTISYVHASATEAWLGDATSLVFDTADIPGFDPAWIGSTTVDHLWFSVSSHEPGLIRSTVVGHPPETEPLGAAAKRENSLRAQGAISRMLPRL